MASDAATLHDEVVLARRPLGMPEAADFALVRRLRPRPSDGELLLSVRWLSIDPYLRPLLAGRYLVGPPAIGDTIPGQGLGEVIASNAVGFAPGDRVIAETGWRERAVVAAGSARRIDPGRAPESKWLGVLGIPGLTAWAGVRTILRPKPGETMLVSAAAGAVGSLVGQLITRAGARAIAVNGSAEKNALACAEFGYSAGVSYRDPDFAAALRAACPDGIDGYFDNVGGRVLDAAIGMLKRHARVALCGLIDQYNADTRPVGPNLGPVIGARATLTGLVVHDHLDALGAFVEELAPLVASGAIRARDDVLDGLARAPEQFIRLLEGQNVGKALVRVAPR